MPIPTVVQWQKSTSAFLRTRDNPLILDIDTLLGAYHASGKTDVQKQKILILMLYICTQWLVNKGGGNWRRPAVKGLIGDVETELRTPGMTKATQDRLERGGKGLTLKEDPIELLQPRDISTKLNLSGTTQFSRLTAHDSKGFISGWGARKDLTGHLKKLQGIAINDYVDELKILAAGNATGRLQKDLSYLSKTDRLENQLVCPKELFCLYGKEQPYSSRQGVGDLFVMDNLEFIYVSQLKAAGKFHHSSFLSGRPVLCAGEIMLTLGKITYISNTSGHYRPSVQDLIQCVTILQDKYGCNLRQIRVEVTISQFKSITWKSAAEFLKYQGVPQAAAQSADVI